MDQFEFEDTYVAFIERGSGPPVVLLHNAGSSHVIWRSQIEALARHRRVYALDLFGYGDSSHSTAGGYTLDRYADMVEGFLEHQGIRSAAFVGNCLGSAISLTVARRSPGTVDALVVCNPLTTSTAFAGDLGLLARIVANLPAAITGVANGLTAPRWLINATARRFWFSDPKAYERNRETVADIANYRMQAFAGLVQGLNSFAVLDDWSESDRVALPPVCTIWGLDNRVLSADAGRILNAKIRPAREEYLPRSGHVPMLENSAQIDSIITEFLDEHAPVSTPHPDEVTQ